jgi:uncharacterized protein
MRRFALAAAVLGVLAGAAAAEPQTTPSAALRDGQPTPPPPPASAAPLPASPTRFVTDRAGLLSPAAVGELDAKLAAYERGTGHQVIVYVDRTTGGVPIEDWAVRAFQGWRVGRQGLDDGVALFLFTADRRVRIEVGYGLEERVPDAVASRLIAERIVPRLRAGDGDGAVRAGVDGLMAAIGGSPAGQGEPAPAPLPRWMFVAGALAMIFFIGLAARHPAAAMWLLYTIGPGRGFRSRGGGGFSGGGFSGGGFSGGGGRSGGGGASGSW